MAGIHAPQWVKNHSGGCVDVKPDSANGNTGCVPRYWTDDYHADYVKLMTAVANRYEANPQVVEMANSECTTIYAEPFILGADGASIDRLWSAGYTKAGHGQCLRRSTDALMNLFPTTRISLAGHSKWQFITPGSGATATATYAASWEDERAMLNELSTKYGAAWSSTTTASAPTTRPARPRVSPAPRRPAGTATWPVCPPRPRRTAGSSPSTVAP